jgi:hypothetical protein
MAYTEEELWDMSDDELRSAFKEAKAEGMSPETDIEQEEEYLEQPETESDDNAYSEEEVEVDAVEESEVEDTDPDEESETAEEETESVKTKAEAEEQPVQKRTYRANGKEYEFTDAEIFERFGQVFGQAMDYTRKTQQLKPWRKTIDAIEQAKLSEEDLSLAIDVLKGDKDAIAALLKRTGVDALELDVDNVAYKPRDYGRNETELAIKDIVEEISRDKEYEVTYDILEHQWDDKSRKEFADNPELIRQLHIDVKNGMFDTLAPIVHKMRVYDRGRSSDLDYYKKAAEQYFADQRDTQTREQVTTQKTAEREKVETVKAEAAKREATKSAAVKRKAAAPTTKAAGAGKVVDYLNMSDTDYEEWYKTLQDSQ